MPDRDDDFPDVEFFADDDDTSSVSRERRDDPEDRPPPEPTRMVSPEDDFGFEDEPDEQPPPRRRGRGRGRGSPGGARSRARGRGPRRPRGGVGGAGLLSHPRARLFLGVALAVILILVLIVVVRQCQRSALEESYRNYMTSVSQLVTESAEQGKQLRVTLTNQGGDNPPTLRQKVGAIRDQAQALVDRAEDLDPPDGLSGAQRSLVTSLEYRVAGLTQLSESIPQIIQSSDLDFAGALIANPMQRFLASDVIYEDSFLNPAQKALEDDDITDVKAPEKQPFLGNVGFASLGGAKALLPGLKRQSPNSADSGGSGSGNLRGTSLVRTEALPDGTRLTPGSAVTVQASEELKWAVTVQNGGDFVENGVTVTATFTYPDSPGEAQTTEGSIETIAPGDEITIELAGPPDVTFGEQGTLEITIAPVPNETRVDNNTASYPVRITI